jgi:hypothetical protein
VGVELAGAAGAAAGAEEGAAEVLSWAATGVLVSTEADSDAVELFFAA